jgi:hypothetical protein
MKTHRMTEEEMEGPISFWGYKEQESNLILPEHHDDDEIQFLISMSNFKEYVKIQNLNIL